MTKVLIKLLRMPKFRWLKRLAFLCRGVFYAGTKYQCPCCGWSLRTFVDRGSFLTTSTDGYCPRCNSKARHRRIWLYLQAQTNLFADELILLEIGPWWSFGRRFKYMNSLEFVGLDLDPTAANVSVAGNLSASPFMPDTFDAILCIHVLEHISKDREALRELFRVLKPGGWAVVSVPLLLDEITREDPSITSAEDRQRIFGEKGHVRYYGTDFRSRIEAAGFRTSFSPAKSISQDVRDTFGLRDDENIFHCIKPLPDELQTG